MSGPTEKCSAQAAQYHVDTDSKRYKKDGSIDIHAGQRRDNGTAAQEELTADQNVCQEREEDEDPMRKDAITGVDDLQESMASRGVLLDFTG